MGDRIGIIRGVFDPVHNGHGSAIIDSFKSLALSKLYVAIKLVGEKDPIASLEQRMEMMGLQLEGCSLPIEIIKQNVRGHLVELLELSEKHSDPIINICGSDKIAREMKVYGKKGDTFGVVCRSEFDIGDSVYQDAQDMDIELQTIIPSFSTSSTHIRSQLLENFNDNNRLSPEVMSYIERNGLYMDNNYDKAVFFSEWYGLLSKLSTTFSDIDLVSIYPPTFNPIQHKSSRNEKFIRIIAKTHQLKGDKLADFVSVAQSFK